MYAFFRLSMPKVNSWNGKWSGEGKNLVAKAVVQNDDLIGRSFLHDFGDGWVAQVTVSRDDSDKGSEGFFGYEWMITSLIEHGEIR